MSFLDRVMHLEEPGTLNHQLQASLYEWQLGGMTRADVISLHDITPAEEAELDWLKARYQDAITNGKLAEFSQVLDNVIILAEKQMFYDTKAKVQARLTAASGP